MEAQTGKKGAPSVIGNQLLLNDVLCIHENSKEDMAKDFASSCRFHSIYLLINLSNLLFFTPAKLQIKKRATKSRTQILVTGLQQTTII